MRRPREDHGGGRNQRAVRGSNAPPALRPSESGSSGVPPTRRRRASFIVRAQLPASVEHRNEPSGGHGPARLGDETLPISRTRKERAIFAEIAPSVRSHDRQRFAGIFRRFECKPRLAENRGVPGSSPGLAIRSPPPFPGSGAVSGCGADVPKSVPHRRRGTGAELVLRERLVTAHPAGGKYG